MPSEAHRLRPRKQPRQVRAALTRDRILDAAARVFAEHGYAAGTTNRIAERARVSVGSLYQYFPNKDAILLELLDRHLDRPPGPAPDPAGPLPDVVHHLVRASIDRHRDDPRLLRVMVEQGPRARELLDRVETGGREQVAGIRALLAAQPDVAVDDLDTAAALVVSTVELVVHHLVAEPAAVDPDRLEAELVTMLVRYLAPSHPAAPARQDDDGPARRGGRG